MNMIIYCFVFLVFFFKQIHQIPFMSVASVRWQKSVCREHQTSANAATCRSAWDHQGWVNIRAGCWIKEATKIKTSQSSFIMTGITGGRVTVLGVGFKSSWAFPSPVLGSSVCDKHPDLIGSWLLQQPSLPTRFFLSPWNSLLIPPLY